MGLSAKTLCPYHARAWIVFICHTYLGFLRGKRNKLEEMGRVTRLGWGGSSEKIILGLGDFGKEERAQGFMIKGNWVFGNG